MITFINQEYKIHVGLNQALTKYPESSIIREFVQNAEDAGADEIIVKLDTSTYGTKTLLSNPSIDRKNLCKLQGASLIIYNNGVFLDKDWEGIKYIGIGSKRQDIKSIGNFGLGFNSCYHVTDTPQIVSGNTFWCLDPLNLIGGGPRVNFLEQSDAHQLYSDQFEPFKQFGCDFKSYFNGTIIRLPLRTESSLLKKTPLKLDSIIEILDEFGFEVPYIPIFLKRISSITLEKDNTMISSVKVSNYLEIKKERETIGNALSGIVDKMKNPQDINEFTKILCNKSTSISSSYKMEVVIEKSSSSPIYGKNNIEIKTISYGISQGIYIPTLKEEKSKLLEMVKNSDSKLIPYGGVCIPLLINGSTDSIKDFKGRPFCFLPIGSLEFNLPMHSNGFFLLSDARSDIKYSSSNLTYSQEFKSYQWNQFIAKTIIPYFYANGLEFMKQLLVNSCDGLYEFFPFRKSNSKIEQDISSSTMNLIINGHGLDSKVPHYKFFKNNQLGCYDYLSKGFIVRNETPKVAIDYFKSKKIQFYSPPLLLIHYFQENGFKFDIFSNSLLCDYLREPKYQLDEYNSELLSLLLKSQESILLLDGIPIIPVKEIVDNVQICTVLHSLKKQYTTGQEFLLLPDTKDSFNLIFKIINEYPMRLPYLCKLINPELVPKEFKENIDQLYSKYPNLFRFNLDEFLLILLNVNTNFKFQRNDIDLIWNCLLKQDTYNGGWSKSLNLENLEQLNIIPVTNYHSVDGSDGVQFVNYKQFKILPSSKLPDEKKDILIKIFEKLDILLVEKDHCSISLFNEPPFRKLLTNYIPQVPLENILSIKEINDLRVYLAESLDLEIIVGSKEKNKFISPFFNLHIHPCVGNGGSILIKNRNGSNYVKHFTNIDCNSICVAWDKIEKYVIDGHVLVRVDDFSKKLLLALPNQERIYKDEESTYIDYLLPNIQKFTNFETSIEIIKSFCSRFKDSLHKIKSDLKWIPNVNHQFDFPKRFYILSENEKNLLIEGKPEIIIHQSLLEYSKELISIGVNPKYPVQEIINNVPNTIYKYKNVQLYHSFLNYLKETHQLFNPPATNSTTFINNNNNSEKLYLKNKNQKTVQQQSFQPQNNLINLDETFSHIKDIKFIPSTEVISYKGFEPNEFISPSSATISSNKNIMFSVKHAVEIDLNNPLYKLISKEDPRSIIKHWVNLTKMVSDDPKSIDSSINLNEVFNLIYKSINRSIEKNIGNFIWENELKPIKAFGKIWIEDKLVVTNDIIIQDSFNFEPYIYSITKKFPSFINLFSLIGISEQLQISNYMTILIKVFKQYSGDNVTDPQNMISKPIPKNIFGMCIESINSIGKLGEPELLKSNPDSKLKTKKLPNYQGGPINVEYIPTSDNRLVSFKNVLSCESDMIQHSLKSKGYYKLHDHVDNLAIKILKIKREQQVSQRDCSGSLFMDGFGQREDLIDRLKSILKDYRQDTLLNEFIQNCIDAKGKCLELMIDCNHYKNEFIDIEYCKDFQDYLEKSLVVYNDSVFTDMDIKNIQVLSGTYKKYDNSFVGRFGVGVNSMYNFTNIPSILSGGYLLVFDPLLTHLEPSTSKYSTGLKISVSEYQNHPDLFKPFQQYEKHYGFNLETGYVEGTIFRFPLRNALRRNSINIIDSYWDFESIYELFHSIINYNMENQLLFVNMDRISLSILEEANKNGESIKKNIITVKKKDFQIHFNSELSLKEQENYHNSPSILSSFQIENLHSQFPIEIQRVQFEKIQDNKTETLNYFIGKYLENPDKSDQSKLNKIDAFKFVNIYNKTGREKRRVAGGIAFKILENGHLDIYNSTKGSDIMETCKSFCFLPFKDLNLPVNIHASFSVSSSREILESNKSGKSEISDPLKTELEVSLQNSESFLIEWNNILMKSIIAPIYLDTLFFFKQNYILGRGNNNDLDLYYRFYYSLFPNKPTKQCTSIFETLSKQFYDIIESNHSKSLNLFLPINCDIQNKINTETYYIDKTEPLQQIFPLVVKFLSQFYNIKSIPKSYSNNIQIVKSKLVDYKLVIVSIKSKKQFLLKEIIEDKDLIQIFEYLILCAPATDIIGCPLLILEDKSREFLGEKFSMIYNDKFLSIYPNPSEFICKELSQKLETRSDEWLSTLKIENFDFGDMFFNHLMGGLKDYDANHIYDILGHIKENLNSFTNDQIEKLKNSPIIPFVIDEKFKVLKMKSVSQLFDLKFKAYHLSLDYPPDYFISENENWSNFFNKLGIKKELNSNDFIGQFKSVSSDFYKSKPIDDIVRRVEYLWSSSSEEQIHKIWDEIYELSIIPTKSCPIEGSKSDRPVLSSINKCINESNQNIGFHSCFISARTIYYPKDHPNFNPDNIMDNFIYLLSKIRFKEPDKHLFQYLYETCASLEKYHKLLHIDDTLISKIKRLPDQDKGTFVTFNEIIFGSPHRNVSPFFNLLPSKLELYKNLFLRLGAKRFDEKMIIEKFIYYSINNISLNKNEQIVAINLYSMLSPKYRSSEDLLILTECGYFKPRSQVYYNRDNLLQQRIVQSNGQLFKLNNGLDPSIYSIGELKDMITEEIDDEKTNLDYEKTNELEPRSDIISNRLNNPDFIKFINSLFGLDHSKIRNITGIRHSSGDIHTKLLFNGTDITLISNVDYFYDKRNPHLYLNHTLSKQQVLKHLHLDVLEFDNNISNQLENFDKITTNIGDSNPIGALNQQQSIFLNGTFIFCSGVSSNPSNIASISKQLYESAVHDFKVSKLLFNYNLYDDAVIYCFNVIEKSIKSILVQKTQSFNNSYNLSYLKNKIESLSTLQLPDLPNKIDPTLLKYNKNQIDQETARNVIQTSEIYLNISNSL